MTLAQSRQHLKELTFFGRHAVDRNGQRLIRDVRLDDWAAAHYEAEARFVYADERAHAEFVDMGGES